MNLCNTDMLESVAVDITVTHSTFFSSQDFCISTCFNLMSPGL